jgi:hypothetical protein
MKIDVAQTQRVDVALSIGTNAESVTVNEDVRFSVEK